MKRYMRIQKINSKIMLDNTLAYLAGIIVGDGNLASWTKSRTDLSMDYRISIDLSDVDHISFLEKLIKTIINTRTTAKNSTIKGNRIPRKYLSIRNKRLFLFLSKDLGIPTGNKSSIVSVPSKIMNNSRDIKNAFLAGYFDSDGGFRGRTIGFTSASKALLTNVSKLLKEIGVEHSNESWFNKKYNKKYFGIRIRKNKIDRFLNVVPLQNKQKLIRILERFMCGDAGVAKRDSKF